MTVLDTRTLRERRAAERRRRGRRRLVVLLAALALLAGLGAAVSGGRGTPAVGPAAPAVRASAGGSLLPPASAQASLGPVAPAARADTRDEVRLRFAHPPRAGLLADLDTGQVLWRRHPERALPIASLTKMMTALVSVERLGPRESAPITRQVLNYSGSGMGVLPRGRRIGVEPLLYGLMLPSGNDAARALALRVSGSLGAFVRLMDAHAVRWGLRCTRFGSVEGLSDRNRSCPQDLAALADRVLAQPRLARIVRRDHVVLHLPIKGGKAFLYTHNPLVHDRYRGVLGVKTGFTTAAGHCLVAAARRHGHRLVAVVLHSPDPGGQAKKLLDRGFAAIR